jgi:hypothetical protein
VRDEPNIPDNTKGPAVEVSLASENKRFTRLDTLAHICPLAGDFEAGLDGLCASVHGEDHVVAEHGGEVAGEGGEDGVVKGTGTEGELASLLDQGGENLGVAVTLIDGSSEVN